MSHQKHSLKSIFYALSANLAIFVAKLAAAIITNSGAMLAESIHSLADSGNQGLLLLGIRNAKRPPDEFHPLGYGKHLYFWSFIVAIMLFSMGGLFSVYEGIHKLQNPEPMSSPLVAIAVLIFAMVAEGLSLMGCIQAVNKVRYGRSFLTWFRETRQSELMVIFGEDLAALLGLGFALCAIVLTIVTGNPTFDAIGSIGIGLLLMFVALMVGIEVKELLVGQGVEDIEHRRMMDFLHAQEEVEEVYNLLTLQLGSDVMVAVKARMQRQDSELAMVAAINSVEARFKDQFPNVMWSFFEPDITD